MRRLHGTRRLGAGAAGAHQHQPPLHLAARSTCGHAAAAAGGPAAQLQRPCTGGRQRRQQPVGCAPACGGRLPGQQHGCAPSQGAPTPAAARHSGSQAVCRLASCLLDCHSRRRQRVFSLSKAATGGGAAGAAVGSARTAPSGGRALQQPRAASFRHAPRLHAHPERHAAEQSKRRRAARRWRCGDGRRCAPAAHAQLAAAAGSAAAAAGTPPPGASRLAHGRLLLGSRLSSQPFQVRARLPVERLLWCARCRPSLCQPAIVVSPCPAPTCFPPLLPLAQRPLAHGADCQPREAAAGRPARPRAS